MRRVLKTILFIGLISAAFIVILLTAWIALSILSIGVGILTVTGGPLAMALAALISWRLRRKVRLAVAWALVAGGVFFAIPAHEFFHILPVILARESVEIIIRFPVLEINYDEGLPKWLETLRLLVPFIMSAVGIVLVPFLMRFQNWEKYPWAAFCLAASIGSGIMSTTYALVAGTGFLGEHGDIYGLARNLSMSTWKVGLVLAGTHVLAAGMATVLMVLPRRQKPRS